MKTKSKTMRAKRRRQDRADKRLLGRVAWNKALLFCGYVSAMGKLFSPRTLSGSKPNDLR